MYLSHNIVKQIAELEVLIYRLNQLSFNDIQNNSLAEDRNTGLIESYAHSLGLPLTSKEARKLLEGQKLETNDFRGVLLENFKITLKLLESLVVAEHIPLNSQVVLEINQNLAKGAVEDWRLRYREAPETASLVYDDFNTLEVLSQAPDNIQDKFEIILQDFNGKNNEERIYKISQLSYQFLRLQPFLSLNKFTLACVVDLLLAKLVSPNLQKFNIFKFFLENKERILKITELTPESTAEVYWHELFIGGILEVLSDETVNLFTTKTTNQVKQNKDKPFLDLNKRQLKILKYLQTIPTVKREDYVQMLDVSTMTAYRDLNQLLQYNLIRQVGTGRGTKYLLASR